jgi:hypothetical protein
MLAKAAAVCSRVAKDIGLSGTIAPSFRPTARAIRSAKVSSKPTPAAGFPPAAGSDSAHLKGIDYCPVFVKNDALTVESFPAQLRSGIRLSFMSFFTY